MSRTISQDIIDKLESNQITLFNLLQFTVGTTTYRYTDCEVPITYAVDGTAEVTFQPRAFSFDNVSYSDNDIVDSVSIRVDNLDSVLTSLFLDNVIAEEECILYLILFNDDNSILGVQQLFNGMINDFTLDESELTMTVTSIFTKWNQMSGSKHPTQCRWKVFKGVECQYAGAETECDRGYTRCDELSNTVNFGGFRWLPPIEDEKIWWGPDNSNES